MAKEVNARDIALGVLMEIEGGCFSDQALNNALFKNQFIAKQDRAFITRLTEGVTERRITLDYVIDTYAKTGTKRMKPFIKNVLRMGAYQLLYMERVPGHAAIFESVKLARLHGFTPLSGFCNGVLRSIARGGTNISLPKDPKEKLSVLYSTPLWLVEKLMEDYPEECESILAAAFMERKTSIRVNTAKLSADTLFKKLKDSGVSVERGGYSKRALLISDYDAIRRLPGFLSGEFSVQDESSMASCDALAEALLKSGKDAPLVWDVCAAPGGKTTAVAESLPKARVISMDLTEEKLEKIRENQERLELKKQITVMAHDATTPFLKLMDFGRPDAVICDLPCSGLGVMGHKNDIKYRVTGEDIKSLQTLQREILDNAAPCVAPGGYLMYSTCTITPEENGENAEWFLRSHGDFESVCERQFLPGREDCDGFYYHLMKKTEESYGA